MTLPDADQSAPLPLVRIGVALFLAGFATFSLVYCTQPLLPVLAIDFAVSPASASLALSLTTICLAVAILISGAVSEATGRRGLMFGAMLGAACLNLVAAWLPNWHGLLAVRALEGIVLGGVPAVAMAYLAEEMPEKRLSLAMGLYVSGTAAGGMIGRVVIGAVSEAWSWRGALTALSLLDIVAAIAFILLLPPSRNFVRRPGINLRYHLAAWGRHLHHPALPHLFIIGFLGMGAFVALYNFIGFRLMAPPFAIGQTEIGLVFLAYLFGMAASSSGGALADRFGRAQIALAGMGIMIVGLLLTLPQHLPTVIAGIIIATMGFFAVHAVISSWVSGQAQGHKSHASSLYLLAYYLGASLIGSGAGWLWDHWGWASVVALCVGLEMATFTMTWRLSRRAH